MSSHASCHEEEPTDLVPEAHPFDLSFDSKTNTPGSSKHNTPKTSKCNTPYSSRNASCNNSRSNSFNTLASGSAGEKSATEATSATSSSGKKTRLIDLCRAAPSKPVSSTPSVPIPDTIVSAEDGSISYITSDLSSMCKIIPNSQDSDERLTETETAEKANIPETSQLSHGNDPEKYESDNLVGPTQKRCVLQKVLSLSFSSSVPAC